MKEFDPVRYDREKQIPRLQRLITFTENSLNQRGAHYLEKEDVYVYIDQMTLQAFKGGMLGLLTETKDPQTPSS